MIGSQIEQDPLKHCCKTMDDTKTEEQLPEFSRMDKQDPPVGKE